MSSRGLIITKFVETDKQSIRISIKLAQIEVSYLQYEDPIFLCYLPENAQQRAFNGATNSNSAEIRLTKASSFKSHTDNTLDMHNKD